MLYNIRSNLLLYMNFNNIAIKVDSEMIHYTCHYNAKLLLPDHFLRSIEYNFFPLAFPDNILWTKTKKVTFPLSGIWIF